MLVEDLHEVLEVIDIKDLKEIVGMIKQVNIEDLNAIAGIVKHVKSRRQRNDRAVKDILQTIKVDDIGELVRGVQT